MDVNMSEKSKMTVVMPRDVELTPDEYRKLVDIEETTAAALNIFDLVEYEGEYKKPTFAMITGINLRAGGWLYTGISVRLKGRESVSFSEKDVIRLVDKAL
jgi:hypothetical protein